MDVIGWSMTFNDFALFLPRKFMETFLLLPEPARSFEAVMQPGVHLCLSMIDHLSAPEVLRIFEHYIETDSGISAA